MPKLCANLKTGLRKCTHFNGKGHRRIFCTHCKIRRSFAVVLHQRLQRAALATVYVQKSLKKKYCTQAYGIYKNYHHQFKEVNNNRTGVYFLYSAYNQDKLHNSVIVFKYSSVLYYKIF